MPTSPETTHPDCHDSRREAANDRFRTQASVWDALALRRDFERRRAELKQQGADDAVFQCDPSTPRNVELDRAHLVPDADWETADDPEASPIPDSTP